LVFGEEFAMMCLVTKTVCQPLPKEANHGEEKEGSQEEGDQEESNQEEGQEEEVTVPRLIGPLTPSHEDRRQPEGRTIQDDWPRLKPAPTGSALVFLFQVVTGILPIENFLQFLRRSVR
jgi:hypothetical protein